MQTTMPDLDPATHAQISELLGRERAAKLLGLLEEALIALDRMPETDLSGPAGLAAIHRLKSEAGMMGFLRVSGACQAIEAARDAVPEEDWTALRSAVAGARAVIDALPGHPTRAGAAGQAARRSAAGAKCPR